MKTLYRGFAENPNGKTTIYIDGVAYVGEWVYGYYWTNELGNHFIIQTIDPISHEFIIEQQEVIFETVCQYTNVDDKDGRMIFDKDWVTIPAYGKGKYLTNFYFAYGKFAVDGSNYGFKDLSSKTTKVMGNMFENPEWRKGRV